MPYIVFSILYLIGMIALALVIRDMPLPTKWKDLSIRQMILILMATILPFGSIIGLIIRVY